MEVNFPWLFEALVQGFPACGCVFVIVHILYVCGGMTEHDGWSRNKLEVDQIKYIPRSWMVGMLTRHSPHVYQDKIRCRVHDLVKAVVGQSNKLMIPPEMFERLLNLVSSQIGASDENI